MSIRLLTRAVDVVPESTNKEAGLNASTCVGFRIFLDLTHQSAIHQSTGFYPALFDVRRLPNTAGPGDDRVDADDAPFLVPPVLTQVHFGGLLHHRHRRVNAIRARVLVLVDVLPHPPQHE